jgi:hypothetical protein
MELVHGPSSVVLCSSSPARECGIAYSSSSVPLPWPICQALRVSLALELLLRFWLMFLSVSSNQLLFPNALWLSRNYRRRLIYGNLWIRKGASCLKSCPLKSLTIIYLAISSIIFYVLLVDLVGRRRPVIVSSIACSMCLWFVGAYVKIGHPASVIAAGDVLSPSTTAGGKAATAMIMIYAIL